MNFLPIGLFLLAVSLISACSSAPKRDLTLERIEARLSQLEADSKLGHLASAEIARAKDAIAVLKVAGNVNPVDRARIEYVAEKRVEIAYANAQLAEQQKSLVELQREYDQIIVQASQRDAQLARMEAEKLRVQSLARSEEAETAKQAAAVAMGMQEASAKEADAAKASAAQAKRLAAAQSEEASLARREAELAISAADSLRVQMQDLKASNQSRGKVMTLGEAVFASGKAKIQAEALAALGKVVDFVNQDQTKQILIEGHTDNRGSANLNQALSQKRAEAVRDALLERGVDAARMTAIGKGSTAPVVSNDSNEGRAKNRRVEVILGN